MAPSVLLALPVLLALSTPCSACQCKLQHPQTYFCMSDIGESRETQGSLHQEGLTVGWRNAETGELCRSEQCLQETQEGKS